MPRPWAVLVLAVLLAVTWVVVYMTGGTRTSLPHLFYLPVLVAVLPFGVRGGLVAAVAATLLCGPLMPLDVAEGVPQAADNWLIRGFFFIVVGVATGAAVRSVTAALEHDLTRLFRRELAASAAPVEPSDPGAGERVAAMLDGRDFTCVFQPFYDLGDGRLLGVEALTRFHDGRAFQPPDVWFTMAAQVGLGVELELVTARAALDASRDLPDEVAISINVSPSTMADPRLDALLDRHRGRDVVLEVTEHAVVDDYHALEEAVARLRRRGVRLAVDDTGAGFASLRHIVRLGPDIIKLDISLTQHVRDDPLRRALAAALVQFARQTDTTLIAEGIETASDLGAWQEAGAHAAQGYLLAEPAPPPVPLAPCSAIIERSTVALVS